MAFAHLAFADLFFAQVLHEPAVQPLPCIAPVLRKSFNKSDVHQKWKCIHK